MARSIKDGSNVVDIKTAPKTRGRKPKAAPAPAGTQAPDEERAPAFGHNQPDESLFLSWVQRLNRKDEEGDEIKLKLKNWRGQRKHLRLAAQAEGIVMGDLDDALKDLKTDQADLLSREERRRMYRIWLKLPVTQGSGAKVEKPKNDAAAEKQRWFDRGDQAGRLGKDRGFPEGTPPECMQSWLKGWDAGQEAVLKGSKLTGDAFKPKADAGTGGAPATAKGPSVSGDGSIVVFNEAHFKGGTELEDANMKTLLAEHRDLVEKAHNVAVVFGGKKRILKERDAEIEGGWYLDDGVKAPVSEPEIVAPTAEELA